MNPIELAPPIKIWYKPLPKFPKIPWPMEVVDALGFDLKKLGEPKPGGVSVSGYYKLWTLPEPVNVDIYGNTFSFNFTVIDNPDLIWPCILGENSIFEVAKIDFQKFKSYFEIRFRQDLN